MNPALDHQRLHHIFHTRPDILEGISEAADSKVKIKLFNDISSFVCDRLLGASPDEEPASKRRKVGTADLHDLTTRPAPNAPSTAAVGKLGDAGAAAGKDPIQLAIHDIAFTLPVRKKLWLCFSDNYLYAKNSGTDAVVPETVHHWKDFEYAFYIPVPDKNPEQFYYVLFPRESYLPSKTNPPSKGPIVFSVPAGPARKGGVSGALQDEASAVSDSYTSLLNWALARCLRAAGNGACRLVGADTTVFASSARQVYQTSQKPVHVKAFRGNKDGFLFFLSTGMLWGFKKPVAFLPLDKIVAVSYTNVLKRTFNIVVEFEAGGDEGGTEEIEFSMIDQEDYAAIDGMYVRRFGLQDRSMAEQRKAKLQLTENARDGKKKDGDAGGAENDGDADELTELDKARMAAGGQLFDEDDEEDEEDYDPGTDGESEGEGGTSDEDSDGGDADGGDDEDSDLDEEESFDVVG